MIAVWATKPASSNVLELNSSMGRTFDVRIESLVGQVAVAPAAALAGRHGHLRTFAASGSDAKLTNPAISSVSSDGKKSFYLETFGCQMNAHDSEKVSGLLLGRGYRAVGNPAQADLVRGVRANAVHLVPVEDQLVEGRGGDLRLRWLWRVRCILLLRLGRGLPGLRERTFVAAEPRSGCAWLPYRRQPFRRIARARFVGALR